MKPFIVVLFLQQVIKCWRLKTPLRQCHNSAGTGVFNPRDSSVSVISCSCCFRDIITNPDVSVCRPIVSWQVLVANWIAVLSVMGAASVGIARGLKHARGLSMRVDSKQWLAELDRQAVRHDWRTGK